MPNKRTAREIGVAGENAAAAYLAGQGFVLLQKNYRCPYGEIDMIAADRQYILFVEVKTRGDNSLGRPAQAVDYRKQKRLMRTAVDYLVRHPSALQPRFDIAEVYLPAGSEEAQIHYIPNAFWLEDAYGLF